MQSNTKMKQRTVFYITDEYGTCSFVSAGVLFYFKSSDGIFYLMQKRKDKPYIEDIGGKSEPCDKSLIDLAKREIMEELNILAPKDLRPNHDIIDQTFIEKSLPESKQILIPKSKYVVFMVELPCSSKFDLKCFGTSEYFADGKVRLERDMIWVHEKKLKRSSVIHPRLRSVLKFL
jgi:8-oxo-dGTP pyrophosphatase MutT (NUDIX family)